MNKTKAWISGALAAIGLVGGAGVANAAYIDFSTQGLSSGSGLVQCTGNVCTGSNILVNGVAWNNDAGNSGALAITATLNFSNVAGNNFFTISGAIPTMGINDPIVLLTGTISALTASVNGPSLFIQAFGPDSKAAELLAYTGFAGISSWAFASYSINAQLTACPAGVTGICWGAVSSDTLNYPTPEPGSLALLGLGLLGIGAARRRKTA